MLCGLQADFLFSFYYRHMIGATLLRGARRGALNMQRARRLDEDARAARQVSVVRERAEGCDGG